MLFGTYHRDVNRLKGLGLWLVALLLSLYPLTAHAEVLDRIVAVVAIQDLMNTHVKPQIITQSEVDAVIQPLVRQLRAAGESVQLKTLHTRALDDLIWRALRNQKADQLGISIEKQEIDALMRQVERDNRLSQGSLRKVLRHQGVSLKQYRAELKDKLLQTHLINRVIRPMVAVSDDEVRLLQERMQTVRHFNKIRLSQILLKVSKNASAHHVRQTRQKAHSLLDKLRKGRSLAALAGHHSGDSSWLSGGDIGWFRRGELLPEMEKALVGLNKGDLAGPVRSSQGFHIFKVMDIQRGAPANPLKTQRKDWVARVMESKLKARYEQWLRELRQRAFVEFR